MQATNTIIKPDNPKGKSGFFVHFRETPKVALYSPFIFLTRKNYFSDQEKNFL